MVFSTRHPSLTAWRLLTPWMRHRSWLGTSVMASPAWAALTFISVSISKPSQSSAMASRWRDQKAL